MEVLKDMALLPMPLIVLLVVGLLCRGARFGRRMLELAAFLFVVLSLPIVGHLITLPLQTGALARVEKNVSTPKYIVVLTGGIYNDGAGGWRPSASTVRRIRAAQRYKQRRGGIILISGGRIGVHAPAESSTASQILGLGANARLEKKARNTAESATNVTRELKRLGVTRIALATDAVHIRRAAAAFRHHGIDIAVAVTPRLGLTGDRLLYLPSAHGFNLSAQAWREYLAIGWYLINREINFDDLSYS